MNANPTLGADTLKDLLGDELITAQATSTDQEYDELEEMLRADAGEDNMLDSLDSLLSESMQQAADRKASQSLLSRIRQGRASEAEKAQANVVELKASWQAVASCEMWDQVNCACGHSQGFFTQYMIEYRPMYQTMGSSHRWVKAEPEALPAGLPQKAIFNVREVFHCSECSSPPEDAEIIIWANGITLPATLEGEE